MYRFPMNKKFRFFLHFFSKFPIFAAETTEVLVTIIFGKILAFATILYHLLKLRKFHVYMIKNKMTSAYV